MTRSLLLIHALKLKIGLVCHVGGDSRRGLGSLSGYFHDGGIFFPQKELDLPSAQLLGLSTVSFAKLSRFVAIGHYQNEWEPGSESATQRHLGSFGGTGQTKIPSKNAAPIQLWLFVQPGTCLFD